MAAWVTLRSGVVLKYSECTYLVRDADDYVLMTEKNGEYIADFPRDVVERFEWRRPWATYRTPRKDKLMVLK